MQLISGSIVCIVWLIFGIFLWYRVRSIQSSISKRFEDHQSIDAGRSIFGWIIFFIRLILGLLLILLVITLF